MRRILRRFWFLRFRGAAARGRRIEEPRSGIGVALSRRPATAVTQKLD